VDLIRNLYIGVVLFHLHMYPCFVAVASHVEYGSARHYSSDFIVAF